MKIKYRFVFAWTEARGSQLSALGLKVESSGGPLPQTGGIGVGHAVEGAPGWSEACSLVRSWDGRATVTTEFTASEVNTASHCALVVVHASGYPQPEHDLSYREVTYDTSERCSKCGEGAVQVAPFRVKKSLKWGRNAFLKLNWIEEACFMQTSVWKEHLSGLGVCALPVEDPKGQPLDDVVQLDLGPTVPLSMGGVRGISCEKCRREIYPWHDRGFFPAPLSPPDAPIFRSLQRFGVERQATNAIFVSPEVAKAIKGAGLRGAELWPCMPAE